jgi:hypothetical protein
MPKQSAPAAKPNSNFSVSGIKSRATWLQTIAAMPNLTEAERAVITHRIAAVAPEHDILRVSLAGHPHKHGFNFTFTVSAA